MKTTISTYEFLKKFPDERAARDYMESRRWPQGNIACPYCRAPERIQKRARDGYYRCLSCKNDFTVRTGTIFARSHVPLDKWLMAAYLMVTARKGISSLQLSKEIGVTQKTAWFMQQRLREACGNTGTGDNNNLLSGTVEADETYIGGKESNKHSSRKLKAGRGIVGKIAVLGMRQRKGDTRAIVMSDTTAISIQNALNAQIANGSVLCTDEHRSYIGNKFQHKAVNHSAKQFVDGMAHTNGIESVWAILKRGFYGVYHQFSEKHLQRYANEFTYRLNEGKCSVPTMDRIDSLLIKTSGIRLPYAYLTRG